VNIYKTSVSSDACRSLLIYVGLICRSLLLSYVIPGRLCSKARGFITAEKV